MVALKIEDVKQLTAKLFVDKDFDQFLVREVSITTYNTFSIDGHIKKGYYTSEEIENDTIEEYSSWSILKPICFSLIKGKKLPGSFQITLQLNRKQVCQLVENRNLNIKPEQITGLYMSFRYDSGNLYCVSGTSLEIFMLDKTVELEWDQSVKLFLKKQEITFIEE